MSRMAAHGDLIIFQVAHPGGACTCLACGVAGVTAKLGSYAEDVAEDFLEERFEGWNGGGDEACVELGTDPDC